MEREGGAQTAHRHVTVNAVQHSFERPVYFLHITTVSELFYRLQTPMYVKAAMATAQPGPLRGGEEGWEEVAMVMVGGGQSCGL